MAIDRRKFLSLFGIAPLLIYIQDFKRIRKEKKTKLEFGWTTCLTYQTDERRLGYDYFSNLLDEMDAHDMTQLIVMMASHGNFSPLNHGLAWPVRNEKLRPQLDRKALNAHEETEFFSRVIEKAKALGIKIYIEIKYLGMRGIYEGYPGIEVLRKKNGLIIHTIPREALPEEREKIGALHICCDNKPAHQYMRDKVSDVLTRYRNLDGIVLEHPSYARNTCYCKGTRERLRKDLGKSIDELSVEEYQSWKSQRIRDTLIDLKRLVKSINPKFEFGFYTGFSPSDGDIEGFQLNRGHDPDTLKQVGFDFLMPYCEGRHQDQETRELERVIGYLNFPSIIVHTTIRREPPMNYPLPPKGPEYVKNIIQWGKEYAKTNGQFKGMSFFNEVKIPERNRQAVYDSIAQGKSEGMPVQA
jgi:hypothetical protein